MALFWHSWVWQLCERETGYTSINMTGCTGSEMLWQWHSLVWHLQKETPPIYSVASRISWKGAQGPSSPHSPRSMKKAAIQSYRISPCHSSVDYGNTNTASILDLVFTYTVFLYKEVGHMKRKTRQRFNNHKIWNFFRLLEPTLKHSMKHPRSLLTIILHWHYLFLILFCCNHFLL